jgi:hypothetical protein
LPRRTDSGHAGRDDTPKAAHRRAKRQRLARERRRTQQQRAHGWQADYIAIRDANGPGGPPPPAAKPKRNSVRTAGPVTIRRADGSTTTQPPYGRTELAKIRRRGRERRDASA